MSEEKPKKNARVLERVIVLSLLGFSLVLIYQQGVLLESLDQKVSGLASEVSNFQKRTHGLGYQALELEEVVSYQNGEITDLEGEIWQLEKEVRKNRSLNYEISELRDQIAELKRSF
jgi:peptidoglycan hydrolase CwlO-like protein